MTSPDPLKPWDTPATQAARKAFWAARPEDEDDALDAYAAAVAEATEQAFKDAFEETVAEAVKSRSPEGLRERVEALPRWTDGGFCDGDSGMCGAKMEKDSEGKWLDRNAVLALLTSGGKDHE